MKWNIADCLTRAVALPTMDDTAQLVKHELSAAIRAGEVDLDEHFLRPVPGHYARRLLYRNPELGVSAVVMTWGPGQATAIHDHAGMWCVEGVVAGEIAVTQYDLTSHSDNTYHFDRAGDIQALVGQTGSLIPPFEYHVIANETSKAAVTLHIYGGEMDSCSVYVPDGAGAYERQERQLKYDE